MEQEIPKELKIDKRRISRPFPKKTELSKEQLEDLVNDIVNGMPVCHMMSKYRISEKRINNINILRNDEIVKKRQDIALAQEKQFVPLLIAKRHKALEGISEKDIQNASLAAKGGFIRDITQTERLVAGKSTENINVISAEMDIESLKNYVLNGNKSVTQE